MEFKSLDNGEVLEYSLEYRWGDEESLKEEVPRYKLDAGILNNS